MGYAQLGWQIRKVGESGPPMHPRNYQDCNFVIVHDHTRDRRQSSYLFVAGRTTYESLLKKGRNFAHERGWKLCDSVDSIESIITYRNYKPHNPVSQSIWDQDDASPRQKYFWSAGRSIKESEEDSSPMMFFANQNEEETEEQTSVQQTLEDTDIGDIMFPDPGNGVILAARTEGGKWVSRVWGYGMAKKSVEAITKAYASHAGRTEKAAASSKRKTKLLYVAGGCLAAAGAAVRAGLVPVIPAVGIVFFAAAVLAGAVGAILGLRSPIRKRVLSKSSLPKAAHKILKGSTGMVWSSRTNKSGIVINIPKGATFAEYLDVERDSNIVPDMGGVMVGYDESKYEMRLPDDDRYKNAVFVGSPGAGKTTAMLNIAGGDIMRRKAGHSHTVIWFETKREGGTRLIEMARNVGVDPLYISAGGNTGPQISFLEWKDTKADAGALTEAFAASFDPSSIKEQSRDIFAALFGFAAWVYPDQLKDVGIKEPPNLMRTAWILAGGAGWKRARQLIKHVVDTGLNQEAIQAAMERLSPYIDISERDREMKVSPARNKLNRVKDLPVWNLDLRREIYSWKDLMEMDRPVIVDVATFDDESLAGYSEELIRILLPVAFWTFWSVAKKYCSSWGEERKSVSCYCDEASNLAYNAGSILSEISAQGRSHGINLMLGAQGWTQLAEKTQLAFREAGNKFYFSTDDPISADALAQDFLAEDRYNAGSITQLVPFEALSMIKIGGERFGPLVISIPSEKNWKHKSAWTPPTSSSAVA